METEKRSHDRLMSYSLAVALVEKLDMECALSERERRCLLDLLTARYGLGKNSIFTK